MTPEEMVDAIMAKIDKLSDWEKRFIRDISSRLKTGSYSLSPKQIEKIESIYQNYID